MISLRTIIAIALLLRVLLSLCVVYIISDSNQFYAGDSFSYLQTANELLSSRKFSDHINSNVSVRPGYPLLLIPGIVLGRLLLMTISMQIILSCLSVFLVYRTAHVLFDNEQIASFCALGYAIEPLSIYWTNKIMTETLFTTLCILFLYLLLSYFKTSKTMYNMLSAIVLAASAYVRPVNYYFIYLCNILMIIWAISDKKYRNIRFKACIIFLVLSLSLVGIWVIRNGISTGFYVFSGYEGINWYFLKLHQF